MHQDHLGSTVLTTDSSGTQVASLAYYPFGTTRSSSGTPGTDKQYTGQRLDMSGLYFYNARYYDAGIGRFVSADTVVQDYTNPQNFNRYSYVINNPLRYTDPSGHCFIFCPVIALAVTPMGQAMIVGTVGAVVQWWWQSDAGEEARWNAQRVLNDLVKNIAGPSGGQPGDPNDPFKNIPAIKAPTDRSGLRKAMEKEGIKPPEGMRNPEAHHDLPWRFKDWFAGEGRGLNVNDPRFGRWVEGSSKGESGPHQEWSDQWNKQWAKFIKDNPDASADDVLAELERLRNLPGFPSE